MNELIGIDESMPCVRQLLSPFGVSGLSHCCCRRWIRLALSYSKGKIQCCSQEKSLHSTGINIAQGLPHAQIP